MYIQSKSIEETFKATFKIKSIFLFAQEFKQRNLGGTLAMSKHCYKIYYKDCWWNSSNLNNLLNNTQGKYTTSIIEFEEEIECNTFHLQYNRRQSNWSLQSSLCFVCGRNHQINDCINACQQWSNYHNQQICIMEG